MKQYAHTESPLGRILLVADDALCALYFEGQKHEQRPGAGWVEAPDRPLFDRARKQLAEYFAGKRDRFDLPLAPQGTEFQHRVWKALRAIPAGETVTYGSIARSIGAHAVRRGGDRPQPVVDRRALPPGDRQRRFADRLCRRPRAQARAARAGSAGAGVHAGLSAAPLRAGWFSSAPAD
jgi:hypothetical protein